MGLDWPIHEISKLGMLEYVCVMGGYESTR